MRLAVTVLGLDLFTVELNTDAAEDEAPGDYVSSPVQTGFVLVEREGGTPENVD